MIEDEVVFLFIEKDRFFVVFLRHTLIHQVVLAEDS